MEDLIQAKLRQLVMIQTNIKKEGEWVVEGGFSLEMRDLYIYHEFLVFGYDGDEEWKI